MSARPPRPRNGFTLVEMLVALAIFAMIAVAALALLRFSSAAEAASRTTTERLAASRRFVSVWTADLAQAVPRPTRDAAGTSHPALETPGGEVLVRLVRSGWSNPDGAARSGLQKLEYRVAGGRLERVTYPYPDGAQPGAPVAVLALAGPPTLRFRGKDGVWKDRWDAERDTDLPGAIELNLPQPRGEPLRIVALVGENFR